MASLLGPSKKTCQKIQPRKSHTGPRSLDASVQTKVDGKKTKKTNWVISLTLLLSYNEAEKLIQYHMI